MKKIFKLFLLGIAVSTTLSGCSFSRVNADEEAVLIAKPWFFGHGGVCETPITTGNTWTAWTTDVVTFKITPVQYDEKFTDIMSSDNTPVDLTAHVLIQIKRGKTPVLLSNFGEKWYVNDIQKDLCNEVRNEISKYPMMELTCKRTIYDNASKRIEAVLKNKVYREHIPITILKVIIDKACPNSEVMEEYNKTAAQIQAKQTQIAASQMQTYRKMAEEKRAEADDAYRMKMSLTPEQYIHLRSVEIEKEKVDMVRNKRNVSITMLMGNGATPFYNVK